MDRMAFGFVVIVKDVTDIEEPFVLKNIVSKAMQRIDHNKRMLVLKVLPSFTLV